MDNQSVSNTQNGNGNRNNQASITGHLGNIEADDFRFSTSEATGTTTAVLNLNIAVNPPKQEGTTRVSQAKWYDAVILGELAEAMADILKRGMLVTFSGHITYRSWPAMKDGEQVTFVDEKTGETKQAYQQAASLVVESVTYQARDGQYYLAHEQAGEVVSEAVTLPTMTQQANIVLKGQATNVQFSKAQEATSDQPAHQARLNFTLTEQFTKFSGQLGTRRHRVTMWGDQAVLAASELHDGDQVTVLGAFSPNSYTDPLGVYQQTYNVTCRQLDNYGQKKVMDKFEQAAAPTTPAAPKACASKAARRQAQATA